MGMNKYCSKCGAFIPHWSEKCVACGEPRAERKKPEAQIVEGDINLNILNVRRGTNNRVLFREFALKNAYMGDAKIKIYPVASYHRRGNGDAVRDDKNIAKIELTIIGELE